MAPITRDVDARTLLQTYGVVSVQQMARQHGIDVKKVGRNALISTLAKMLYDRDRIGRSLADLTPTEREVLNRILLVGSEIDTDMLRQQLAAEGLVEATVQPSSFSHFSQPQGSVTNKGSKRFEDIIGRLGVLGLVFSRASPRWHPTVEFRSPGITLFIPEAIRRQLPAVTLPVKTAPPPAREMTGAPDDALRDIYTLAGMAAEEPLQLTSQGLMSKRTLVRVDAALRRPEGAARVRTESDLGRLPFLSVLAQELDLVAPIGNELRAGSALGAFLAQPRGWRLQRLFEAYRTTSWWSELARLRDVSITPRTQLASAHVAAARQRVLAELAEFPAVTWISLSHLIGRLRARAYDFLLARAVLHERYIYFPQYNVEAHIYRENALGLRFERSDGDQAGWELVEGGFIREVVIEPLHWLGLVDLGGAAADTGAAGGEPAAEVFRITPVGAALLQGQTPELPAPETRVVIQPNFQILVFEPAEEGVLFTLDRIAQRVRSQQVTEYQLTRESVYAAQRAGLEIADVIATLERLSATPLPQNVRRSLEDWGALHDRIVIRRHVAAVQSADEATLDRLTADSQLGRLIGTRLAPTLALLRPPEKGPASGGVSTFVETLMGRQARDGLPLPAVSEGNDAGLYPAIALSPEGTITFRDRVPSVYVEHDVQRLAEETGEGRYRLSGARLRQTAHAIGREHSPAEVVLEHLEQLQGGPLPENVAEMVRRWAQDWGRGALVQAVLLQVERKEIMDELLADRSLKRLLHPVSGAPTLATVQPEHVEQVRAELEERGMALQAQML